jgi:hypothetical protein
VLEVEAALNRAVKDHPNNPIFYMERFHKDLMLSDEEVQYRLLLFPSLID